jgi:eukaryotic-like serine/threonine-protein kinase
MDRYRISKNIELTAIDEYYEEGVPPTYKEGYYVLYEASRDKEYLLNGTIKYYIDKFSTPKSSDEVLQEVEQEVQASNGQLKDVCKKFFKFLLKRKILVSEFDDEIAVSLVPLFFEGDVLDGLTITDLISNKRHVDIYLATDQEKSEVIIKLLNRNKFRNERSYKEEVVRLQREYEVVKSVSYISCISHAYNIDTTKDQFAYFTQEYVNGKALSRFLGETESLTEENCFEIAEKILEAFSLLHESNVIHGDIHSSNVLVTEDRTIKIIDLGLSRSVEIDANEVLKFGGVDQYMPPERINISSVKKHTTEPDLYSDVYQIGLLLYLTMYNEIPFVGFTWEELSQNIKETTVDYPILSFKGFKVPEEFICIIKKCIEKEPGKRYKNAAEILGHFKRSAINLKEVELVN